MTWDVYTKTNPVARKEYKCDACELIFRKEFREEDMSPEDWDTFMGAWGCDCKILKGEKYIKLKGFADGEPDTFRARPEIDEICVYNNFYED